MIIIVCKVDCFSFKGQHTIVSKYLEYIMAALNSTCKKLALRNCTFAKSQTIKLSKTLLIPTIQLS